MKLLILLLLFPVAVAFSLTQESMAIHELKSAEMNLALVLSEIRSLYRDEPEFLAALSISQQKWEEYRDAALTARFPKHDKLAEYGSVYPVAYATVRCHSIKQRVAELNVWLEGVDAGEVAAGSVKRKRELEELRQRKRVPSR